MIQPMRMGELWQNDRIVNLNRLLKGTSVPFQDKQPLNVTLATYNVNTIFFPLNPFL